MGILLSLSSGGDQTIKYLGERERGVRVKRYMPRVCTSVLSL